MGDRERDIVAKASPTAEFDKIKPATDLDGNDSLDLIWAGRADEVSDLGLGDGLTNVKGEGGRTKLTLVPATEGSIGGVIPGENVTVDDDGRISIVLPKEYILPTASQTRLGGVKIGSGIKLEEDGTISADNYKLPIATAEKPGGVRIGEGLMVDPTSGIISMSVPVASVDQRGTVRVGQNLSVDADGTISADVPASVIDRVAVLGRDIEQYKKLAIGIGEQFDASEVLNPIIIWGDGRLMAGRCRFNTNTGKKVLLRLEVPFSTTDYHLMIFPSSDTEGTVGEYWVESKQGNSFVVKNSGGNFADTFDWLLIAPGTQYDAANFPFMHGSAKFGGANSGRSVDLPSALASTDYRVMILPSQDSGAKVGEYWVDFKETGKFTVWNTGSATTSFDWIVFAPGRPYNEKTFPFQSGTGSFSGNQGGGAPVAIPQQVDTLNYRVFVSPTQGVSGKLGEYWVERKLTGSFTVKNSGAASARFDWFMFHQPK